MQVLTISAKEAVTRFKYLYDYKPEIYTRANTELSVEEYISYQIALTVTVPVVGSNAQEIRIDDPLVIFVFNGIEYVCSGNSRLQTVARMINGGSKENFADIKYYILDQWDDEELIRRQFATNDTVRRNSRLLKLSKIAEYVDRLVESGMKPADAKRQARVRFALSASDIANAIATKQLKLSDVLNNYLEADILKVDPAIKLMQIQGTHNVTPETVINDLTGKGVPLSIGNIKKWEKEYIDGMATPPTPSTPDPVEELTPIEEYLEKQKQGTDGNGNGKTDEEKKPIQFTKPISADTQVDAVVDADLVPLGEFALKGDRDAISVLEVIGYLIESEMIPDQLENTKMQLFDIMRQLKNVSIPKTARIDIESIFTDSESEIDESVQDSVSGNLEALEEAVEAG